MIEEIVRSDYLFFLLIFLFSIQYNDFITTFTEKGNT